MDGEEKKPISSFSNTLLLFATDPPMGLMTLTKIKMFIFRSEGAIESKRPQEKLWLFA